MYVYTVWNDINPVTISITLNIYSFFLFMTSWSLAKISSPGNYPSTLFL